MDDADYLAGLRRELATAERGARDVREIQAEIDRVTGKPNVERAVKNRRGIERR